jgi:hypothetical protein
LLRIYDSRESHFLLEEIHVQVRMHLFIRNNKVERLVIRNGDVICACLGDSIVSTDLYVR